MIRAHPLESRYNGDLAGFQPVDDIFRIDSADPSFAMHIIRPDGDLPTQPGARLNAKIMQRQGH